MSKNGIRYIFSELAPDDIITRPGPRYLPAGDPICTTGQLAGSGFTQIYSGDSIQCNNIKNSLYDFLMHVGKRSVVSDAADRIYSKLKLSMETGFAAFITTHEYLLNRLTKEEVSSLFEAVDRLLVNGLFKSEKASLSEIGRACENHTNILIHSIGFKNSRYVVTLHGESNGESRLSVFHRNRLKFIDMPAFRGKYVLEAVL